MGIRAALGRWLSQGDAPQNPDELVEIAIIPLAVGPMTVETLLDAGFDAIGAPTYNIVTEVASDYRVLVPRHQSAAARQLLDELRSPG